VLAFSCLVVSACVWGGCTERPPQQASTPEPESPYTGAQACEPCHQDLFQRQSASSHALTFRGVPPGWEAVRAETPRIHDPETGLDYGVVHRDGKTWQVAYEKGREQAAAPLSYLLGSGHHGISPLTHDGERWRYLRLTFFANHGWDRSPMHGRGNASDDDRNVHGWPLSDDDLAQCLRCHTTRLELTGAGVNEAKSEFGVRCESCHGPGRAHVEAMQLAGGPGSRRAAATIDRKIENPSRWSSSTYMALCGQCHNGMSSFEGVQQGTDDDPASLSLVLNQVHGITESKCYKKTGGALRCTSCHDAHNQTSETPAYYVARCSGCHAPGTAKKTACPVQPRGNCLPCHMPRVEVAPHTRFADHWIRANSPFARTPVKR